MENKTHTIANKIYRAVLIICAWFLLLLGLIGILLPVIPTAIFIFVSAGLFAKSSPRLYNWLIRNRFLGKYIVRFHQQRNIPFTIKFFSIIFLNLSLGYTLIYLTQNVLFRSVLVMLSLTMSVYIISLRERHIPKQAIHIEEN